VLVTVVCILNGGDGGVVGCCGGGGNLSLLVAVQNSSQVRNQPPFSFCIFFSTELSLDPDI